VGLPVGSVVGEVDGEIVGLSVEILVGSSLGTCEIYNVGSCDGFDELGPKLGSIVGICEGT